MKRLVLPLVFFVGFGVVRIPIEHHLQAQLSDAGFHQVNLNLDLRDQIGQSAFIAALGGFRALVAAFFWVEAHDSWTRTDWGRMNFQMNSTVSLQPKSPTYWSVAAWHMAWNAGVAAREDKSLPTEGLRIRAERQYWDLGETYYQRGLNALPYRWEMYREYAWFLSQKREDFCAASDFYARAAAFPGTPAYLRRMAAIYLARCPGREREAYQKLRDLYLESESMHVPTILTLLGKLENTLAIPADARLIKASD